MDIDEFIYTKVFNNHGIPIEISMDYSIGSLNEWISTCNKFNNGEKILKFALINIVNGKLICDNLHPFLQNLHPFSQIDYITDLINTHKINN
jgi:hypothetical protein